MTADRVSASVVIDASPQAVFAVLADPARHAAIDGTGWVSEAVDRTPITAAGQVFRMSMYHPNHPDGSYRMSNLVEAFEPSTAISWKPGYLDDEGALQFGGWTWRYDLAPAGANRTSVTLTYDWSAVPGSIRAYLSFPPFPPEHLPRSLAHLAELATA